MARRKWKDRHRETHLSGRSGWLRAAVLGSGDAIISTSSLMIGVAASGASTHATLIAGVAGLIAGAGSMAVGEYVSVSSQRDAERADIAKEKKELEEEPDAELRELKMLYEKQGLSKDLAAKVAEELTKKDALAAHMRVELGIEGAPASKPLQAAWVSALSFSVFALVPILALLVAPAAAAPYAMGGASLLALGGLGALGARLGGARPFRAALRVTLGGALAMGLTAAVGHLFGVNPG